jgi:hypothetical protein
VKGKLPIHPPVATRVSSNSKTGVRSNLYLATNTSLLKEISMVSDSVRRLVSLTNSRKLRKTSKEQTSRANEFHGCPPTTGGGGLTVGENSHPPYLPDESIRRILVPTCNLSHCHGENVKFHVQAGRSLELGRPRRTLPPDTSANETWQGPDFFTKIT